VENTAPLESPEIKAIIDKYSPFLAEAKKRLIFTICAFAVSTLAGFFFYEKIIKFLIDILSLKGVNIVFTSPFQFINLAFSSGIACGIIVSFPLLVAQILSFLKPALKKQEFKMVIRLLPFSLLLFLTGLVFGFFIMKWQIAIFLDRSLALGIGNILDISRLLRTVLMTSVLMGIGFEFPILLILLMHLRIVRRQQLSKIRPWIYLGSFIFAILLPADSILADIVLALPLIILFELTLILSRFQKEVPES
jgi:sec-independent protein translocase protein TatC